MIINVQRKMFSPTEIGDEIHQINTTGYPPYLKRAVVLDVFYDPESLSEEEKDEIAQTVINAEVIDAMPINSVLAMIVSDASGVTAQTNKILFPFFSSHIMLPIKPGETVFIVEEEAGGGMDISYWYTRMNTLRTVEDVNFTHLDRRHDPSMNPVNYQTVDKTQLSDQIPGPGFPNGANTPTTLTLAHDDSQEIKSEPYEQINQKAKASALTNPEPVPRWKKRPQELVFQGSNNTLICLGEDRIDGPVGEIDARKNAGTIDIVVGRGRKMPASDNEEPEGTAPRVITNLRGLLETDKAPFRRDFKKKDNPKEGNPDLKNDASRLYISMQTEADRNFNINLNSVKSLALPSVAGDGTENRAHVIAKSDHLRLVARKDEEKEIFGTILLIREGTQDEDLGYFYIDENGQIQIESTKIYIGKATDETEPMILWTRFRETTERLQDEIDQIHDQFRAFTNIVSSAFGSAIGNLGAPIPSLLASGEPVKEPASNLEEAISDLRPQVLEASDYKSQSTKIFLETED